jgi:8-oxo-dGTP diphosphatase
MKEKNASGKAKRPSVGIGVLVVNVNGQILLSKRKKKYGYGKLALPGGHVEWMESLVATAKREVEEETGLVLDEVVELRDYTEELNPKAKKHYVTFYLIAKLPENQTPVCKEPKKHGPWKWYDPFNLPKDAWEPTVRLCERSGHLIASFIRKIQGDHIAKYNK